MPSRRAYLTFELAGVNDFRALNALLEDGVAGLAAGRRLRDRRVPTVSRPRDALEDAAEEFDVDVDKATTAEIARAGRRHRARVSTDLTIGYTGNQDDLLSLTQLGFDDLQARSRPPRSRRRRRCSTTSTCCGSGRR